MSKKYRLISAVCAIIAACGAGGAAAENLTCEAADAALHWIDRYAVEEFGLEQLTARPVLIIDTFRASSIERLPRPRTEKRSAWRELTPIENNAPLSACELSYAQDVDAGFIIPKSDDPRFDEPEQARYGWRSIDGLMKDPDGRIILRVMSWRDSIGTIFATLRYDPANPDEPIEDIEVTGVF